jgi:hypothetical protein
MKDETLLPDDLIHMAISAIEAFLTIVTLAPITIVVFGLMSPTNYAPPSSPVIQGKLPGMCWSG